MTKKKELSGLVEELIVDLKKGPGLYLVKEKRKKMAPNCGDQIRVYLCPGNNLGEAIQGYLEYKHLEKTIDVFDKKVYEFHIRELRDIGELIENIRGRK